MTKLTSRGVCSTERETITGIAVCDRASPDRRQRLRVASEDRAREGAGGDSASPYARRQPGELARRFRSVANRRDKQRPLRLRSNRRPRSLRTRRAVGEVRQRKHELHPLSRRFEDAEAIAAFAGRGAESPWRHESRARTHDPDRPQRRHEFPVADRDQKGREELASSQPGRDRRQLPWSHARTRVAGSARRRSLPTLRRCAGRRLWERLGR